MLSLIADLALSLMVLYLVIFFLPSNEEKMNNLEKRIQELEQKTHSDQKSLSQDERINILQLKIDSIKKLKIDSIKKSPTIHK